MHQFSVHIGRNRRKATGRAVEDCSGPPAVKQGPLRTAVRSQLRFVKSLTFSESTDKFLRVGAFMKLSRWLNKGNSDACRRKRKK